MSIEHGNEASRERYDHHIEQCLFPIIIGIRIELRERAAKRVGHSQCIYVPRQ